MTVPDPLAAGVHAALARRGATLATAESLTGGELAARVTSVPGASRSYLGGVVSYATEVKVAVLGVRREVIDRHGAVSAECAREMAEGVRRLTGATYSLSTTGVAGPDLQEGKPVGTVFVGIGTPTGCEVVGLELSGGRESVVAGACQEALAALGHVLTRDDNGLR